MRFLACEGLCRKSYIKHDYNKSCICVIFKKKHCQYSGGYLHLKETNINGNCQFLENKKCSIYAARPMQCRTWPFWKENMNVKKWNEELINFCPGIGKGRIISASKIQKQINSDIINDEQIIKNDKP